MNVCRAVGSGRHMEDRVSENEWFDVCIWRTQEVSAGSSEMAQQGMGPVAKPHKLNSNRRGENLLLKLSSDLSTNVAFMTPPPSTK